VQLIATTTFVSLALELYGPSERGADNAMVVRSTLTRTTKTHFYFLLSGLKRADHDNILLMLFYITRIQKIFKAHVRFFFSKGLKENVTVLPES